MPLVPPRDRPPHSHHLHRRAIIDLTHGTPFTGVDATNLSNNPRDITSSVQDVQTELNHAFVLGTGLFLFIILGYISRRQLRSSLSRLVHALSIYRSAAQFIQIHLHTAHYSPLHDIDTIASPVDSEDSCGDLEAAIHANEEPAPPYSPQALNMRERRSKRSLHITVPVMQSVAASPSGSSQEGGASTPLVGDAELSAIPTSFSAAPSATSLVSMETAASSRASSLSNAGALRLASPVVSRFDTYFRPYFHVPIPSHQVDGKDTVVASSSDVPRLSNVSNRSESFMSTASPCPSPPPRYTITIHSSHRLIRCDSTGRPASVPDIVLSPVPWLPRENVPQSPPHYLAIPSRKSRSRRQRTALDSPKIQEAESLKLLATPSSQDEKKSEKRPKKVKNSEVKVRHVFSSPVPLPVLEPAPQSAGPNPPVPRVSKPKQLSRSSTYPLAKRVLPPPPPPRPVLPVDLEAVYPTHLEEDETPVKTDRTMSNGGHSDSWRWPNWPSPASNDRRLARTESYTRHDSYGTEKGAYGEKGEWTHAVRDPTSDSEDVPLAQELLKAIKRRKLRLETIPGRRRETPGFDVSHVLRKGLFGLSAFAAKARTVIERELDSDEEYGEEEEEEEMGENRHGNWEMDATNAFVIGEEEEL